MKSAKLGLLGISTGVLAAVIGCSKLGVFSKAQAMTSVTGNGITQTDRRVCQAFDEVYLTGAYDVRITCGRSQKLEVTCDSNVLPYIETTVSGRSLTIRNTANIKPSRPPIITIAVPDLVGIRSTGTGTIVLAGVENKHLSAQLLGADRLSMTGRTAVLEVTLSGTATVSARSLEASNARVTITGTGDAHVNVTGHLNAKVTGTGRVFYSGSPTTVATQLLGVGGVVAEP